MQLDPALKYLLHLQLHANTRECVVSNDTHRANGSIAIVNSREGKIFSSKPFSWKQINNYVEKEMESHKERTRLSPAGAMTQAENTFDTCSHRASTCNTFEQVLVGRSLNARELLPVEMFDVRS